jgi:hypothetical protein
MTRNACKEADCLPVDNLVFAHARAAVVVVRLATSAFYLPGVFHAYPSPFLRSVEMKLHVLLPAALAIGMVSFVGTQAHAFDLLDGLLGSGSYGVGGKHVQCDGKAAYAPTYAPACGAQKGCAPAYSAQKGCAPRPVVCCEPICIPRLCLLSEACCHIRGAADKLHCKAKALHCKTQALCDEIKVRLFCPRCCQTKGGCEPACSAEQKYGGIPVQRGLEVQK